MATGSCWRSAAFRWLWTSTTVSLAGTEISRLAIPLAAIAGLGAGPAELAALGVATSLPWFLLSLPVGAWSDRLPRRQLMIAADLGRAVLLAMLVIVALAGMLRLDLLLAITFAVGCLSVLYDVAGQALVPTVLAGSDLVDGNGQLATGRSVASATGPIIAGGLVQALTAPVAIVADAASYLVSAACLNQIGMKEVEITKQARRNLRAEIAEGIQVVWRHPILRAIAMTIATANLAATAYLTVELLFATRSLGIAAAAYGLILGVGNLGHMAGALSAGRLTRRFGIGRTVVAGVLLGGSACLILPLASGPQWLMVIVIALGQALCTAGISVTVVTTSGLRQAVTPPALLGRASSVQRLLVQGSPLLGAMLGGFLGETIGLQTTLVVGALGQGAACLWLAFSPIRSLRELPQRAAD